MRKIRFAVIGCGMIGKRHIAMIDGNESAEVCAVCDVRSKESTGVRDGIDYYSNTLDMLMAHPEIEVVCICTPNYFHAQMAIDMLSAGKHVVVEKPMALSAKDARKVAEAEKASGKTAFMVMQNRYSPPSKWIKSVMDNGLLGDLRMVTVNCMWNRDERYYVPGHWHGTQKYDGGTLYTQFSHFIDIMIWLVGPIDVVDAVVVDDFAHKETTDFEDSGSVMFRLKNGCIGSLNYTTAVPMSNLESSITIIGSKGSVKIAGQYMNEVVHCNIENYEMPQLDASNPPNDYGPYKGSAANHCYVIENVVKTLTGNDVPTTTVNEGIAVVETIEEIYKHSNRRTSFVSKKPLKYEPYE